MKNWLRRAEGSWVLYGHYMLKRSLIVFIFNTKAHIMPTNLQLARRATCYKQVRSQLITNLQLGVANFS